MATATLTSWKASFADVSGNTTDLDPNEMGIDNPPDEVLAQFTAAAQAAQLIARSKTVGGDNHFHIDLSGEASAGHQDEDSVTVTVTRSDTPLPEAEAIA